MRASPFDCPFDAAQGSARNPLRLKRAGSTAVRWGDFSFVTRRLSTLSRWRGGVARASFRLLGQSGINRGRVKPFSRPAVTGLERRWFWGHKRFHNTLAQARIHPWFPEERSFTGSAVPTRFLPRIQSPASSLEFRPCFDRISVLARVLAAVFAGSCFLWLQAWVLDKSSRNAYWWLLGVMISCAALFLCYATAVFRAALWEMYARTESPEQAGYVKEVRRELNDRKFLQAGLFFGFLNLLLGVLFGPPYSSTARIVTCFGFFLVG